MENALILIYDDYITFIRKKCTLYIQAGQQRGGHYPCVACTARRGEFSDIEFCLRLPSLSLEDRRLKVIYSCFFITLEKTSSAIRVNNMC